MKLILTAAGYATRLWPLTKDTPKPLLEVKGKPIVDHIIDNVMQIEAVDAVYLVTNHKFAKNFAAWKKKIKHNVPITVFDDGTTSNDDRLGQIGDIYHVLKQAKVEDDVLIIAGDNLFNFSLLEAFNAFKKHGEIVNPLYDPKDIEVAKQMGTVVMDKNMLFTEFYEKVEKPKSTFCSQGVYFVPKARLNLFKKYVDEKHNADKMGYFMSWLLEKNVPVYGIVFDKGWFDIGWLEALEHARKNFKGVQ